MNWLSTIWPELFAVETPVSPNIHKSWPLGSGTLKPLSRDIDLETFSYCDRTGEGVAIGDAVLGDEALGDAALGDAALAAGADVTEPGKTASAETIITANANAARV